MSQPRVVITGLGVVSILGRTISEFAQALYRGQSAIVHLDKRTVSDKRYSVGGQIADFDLAKELPGVNPKRLFRYSQFAMVAADRAIRDAALTLDDRQRARTGTCFGTAAGSVGESADEAKAFAARGERGISPAAWSEVTWSACTTHIALQFGLQGPMACQSSGCVTGLDTIAWGVQQIRDGKADVMVVGGTDTPFHPFVWGLMCRSGILAPAPEDGGTDIPRPFSEHHNGAALVEGATSVVLESETHARLRGARIYGEYLSGISTNSAEPSFDIEKMAQVFAHVMQLVLREAGLPPKAVDWVCAHGTGHPQGDVAESIGIEYALKEHAFCIPVSTIRGAIGQPFASGGGFQVASACLAIQRQQVPPTINFTRPAEGCRLDYVPNVARMARVRTVLINAAGVGGIQSGALIGAYEG